MEKFSDYTTTYRWNIAGEVQLKVGHDFPLYLYCEPTFIKNKYLNDK